jgi:hypothetical protein
MCQLEFGGWWRWSWSGSGGDRDIGIRIRQKTIQKTENPDILHLDF